MSRLFEAIDKLDSYILTESRPDKEAYLNRRKSQLRRGLKLPEGGLKTKESIIDYLNKCKNETELVIVIEAIADKEAFRYLNSKAFELKKQVKDSMFKAGDLIDNDKVFEPFRQALIDEVKAYEFKSDLKEEQNPVAEKSFGRWRLTVQPSNYNNDKLTVTFFDLNADPKKFPGGQQTPATYYVDTLLSDEDGPSITKMPYLRLHMEVPEWTVQHDDLADIAEWLKQFSSNKDMKESDIFKDYDKALPSPNDGRYYLGYNLSDVVDAVQEFYGCNDRREAFGKIKNKELTDEEIKKACERAKIRYEGKELDRSKKIVEFEHPWAKEVSTDLIDKIRTNYAGQTISKRRDKAEQKGGLIYVANELGVEDLFDVLKALEVMCSKGLADEINDSTYKVKESINENNTSTTTLVWEDNPEDGLSIAVKGDYTYEIFKEDDRFRFCLQKGYDPEYDTFEINKEYNEQFDTIEQAKSFAENIAHNINESNNELNKSSLNHIYDICLYNSNKDEVGGFHMDSNTSLEGLLNFIQENYPDTEYTCISITDLTANKEISENQLPIKYRCIRGMSHPNMGAMFEKGKIYTLTKDNGSTVTLDNWNIDKKYLDKNFKKINESEDPKEYRYITNHGVGPGMCPENTFIRSEDLDNGKTAIYLNRVLSDEELKKYDIKPEWIQ